MQPFDQELLKLVVCPRDKQDLRQESDWLICPSGHRYRVIEGFPILLVSEAEQTHIEGTRALAVAEEGNETKLPPIPGEARRDRSNCESGDRSHK